MIAIGPGTPLEAPQGYKNLEAGVTYYFLRSSPVTCLVTLVQFVARPQKEVIYKKAKKSKRLITPQLLPLLERMHRDTFEAGVVRHIVVGAKRALPPWLDGLIGLDLASIDLERQNSSKTHNDRVDEKLFIINPLIQRAEEILDNVDVETVINQHARSRNPQQNETRVRLWLFTFLVFGRNRDSLFYPIHKIGLWDRLKNVSEVKRGRPGEKGAAHGHNTDEAMYEKIIASYTSECGLGITEDEIYTAAMKKQFACKTREVLRGGEKLKELYHPKGEPFPQPGTYFYHVDCRFNPSAVRKAKLGHNRARSKIAPIIGPFTESSWNLMQRVEADGYRVHELPKGYVEGSDLPPLIVVIKRDTASGKKTGIGFSQGSETGAAYRMATFSEAIGLESFGRLFGLRIKSPGKGVSPADITDRGPGATASGLAKDVSLLPVVREVAPAHAGQGKALVETSNPKKPTNDEAPSFIRSNLTVVQLVRKHIFKLLEFNETTNVANRIDPDLEHRVSRQNPNGIWEALESVGRNDALEVEFSKAVRCYLALSDAKLYRSGVTLAGRNYYSKAPEFQAAIGSVGGNSGFDVKVYVLTACVRFVWFDWNGHLIELDVRYPVPVANEVRYMSLEESLEYFNHMKERNRRFAKHVLAAKVEIADDYEAQTGLAWDSGQRVAGRPKRGSAIARQEAAEAARSASGKRAA